MSEEEEARMFQNMEQVNADMLRNMEEEAEEILQNMEDEAEIMLQNMEDENEDIGGILIIIILGIMIYYAHLGMHNSDI